MNCPLCHTPLQKQKDPWYFDCETCYALVKDAAHYLSPEIEKKQYLLHNNDVNDPRYRQFVSPITDFIFGHYRPEDKGLDFGSGTGPVISRVLEERGYDIVQYDLFFTPDTKPLEATYDYIAVCEVVEHFHRPDREFQRLIKLLKPGGRLLIMTLLYEDSAPFARWHYRMDDTHVFIYRRQTIDYICAVFGLHPEVVTGRFLSLQKLSG